MAETVGPGPAVGGITGLALGLSPPHAARTNIKIRITPIMDTPGRERAAGLRSKKIPPLNVDVDLPVNSIASAFLITGTGIPRRFQGGVHSFPCELNRLEGVIEVWAGCRGHFFKSFLQRASSGPLRTH